MEKHDYKLEHTLCEHCKTLRFLKEKGKCRICGHVTCSKHFYLCQRHAIEENRCQHCEKSLDLKQAVYEVKNGNTGHLLVTTTNSTTFHFGNITEVGFDANAI